MANIPTNPQVFPTGGSAAADTSNAESVTGGGASYWGTGNPILVTSNSHPCASRADGALWDVTSGAYVSIQNTNAGTTTFPKNGQ